MEELELGPQLHLFVRVGVESTLERSQITREHMGQLFFQLLRQGLLPKPQFNKGSVRPDARHCRDKMLSFCCVPSTGRRLIKWLLNTWEILIK